MSAPPMSRPSAPKRFDSKFDTIIKKIKDLNLRNRESQPRLTKDDVKIHGKISEPGNPNQRIIVTVKLNVPYIDLLGNENYYLPFYRSSGMYSKGQTGKFQPFLGVMAQKYPDVESFGKKLSELENILGISPEDSILKKDRVYASINMIKCSYIFNFTHYLYRRSVMPDTLKLLDIITKEQDIFKLNVRADKGGKICNEILNNYMEELDRLFKSDDLSEVKDMGISEINDLIGNESIFGVNLSKIENSHEDYDEVYEKLDEYKEKLDTIPDKRDDLNDFLDLLIEAKLRPSYLDIYSFYLDYYKSRNNLDNVLQRYSVPLHGGGNIMVRQQNPKWFFNNNKFYKITKITKSRTYFQQHGSIELTKNLIIPNENSLVKGERWINSVPTKSAKYGWTFGNNYKEIRSLPLSKI